MKDFYLVIPARLESSRLPNKVMLTIKKKTILEWIYLKCRKTINKKNIYILTENIEIVDFCKQKKINCFLTKKTLTGTDKIFEFSKFYKAKFYINVQGDEIFFDTKSLKKIIYTAKKNPRKLLNCYTEIKNKKEYFSQNVPKMVFDSNSNLLYSSRAPIPSNKLKKFIMAYKQVCIYSFPYRELQYFGKLKKKTRFENFEDIEINRFIELGFKVLLIKSKGSIRAIDTIEDYRFAKKNFKKFY